MINDKEALEYALNMLAHWICSVEYNGTSWDDWDEAFKEAAYRDSPIRHLIAAEVDKVKVQYSDL
jgi:hypothetical protein